MVCVCGVGVKKRTMTAHIKVVFAFKKNKLRRKAKREMRAGCQMNNKHAFDSSKLINDFHIRPDKVEGDEQEEEEMIMTSYLINIIKN